MSQAAIPFSFESYLQAKLTAGEVVNMNRIVLANIPDLDHTIPIDRNETLPDASQIVYEQDVDQVGKVNSNAVVYSIVMDTSVGDFDFNAMYLIDKDERTAVGMIVHKETETKTATDETSGVQGNSLVKSMLMQFDGAAAATNITVDAATWQIDYSARLKGMDEDVRIQALDIFGHDAFIGDGFKTTQSTGNQYFVESGAAYIGGLKAVLDGDVTLTVSNLPSFIYAVVNRQGTALSAFANTVDLQVSQDELSDYEANGVNYYVAKIATVNADATVTDERTTSLNEQQFASLQNQLDDLQQQIDDVDADLQGHKGAADPHSQYIQWDHLVGFRFRDSFAGFDRTAIALKSDGTEILRADFPKLWAMAEPIAVDQTFIDADPEQYAANYGTGDGATTFTLPNYGLMPWDAAAGIYGAAGTTVGDAIRNITGQLGNMVGIFQGSTLEFQVASGVFERTSYTRNIANKIGTSEGDYTTGNNVSHLVNFDSSNVVPTADVNRPKSNFSEIWIIHGEIA